MNINYKQPQFELFPGNPDAFDDVNRPRFFLANLSLSIESLFILVILAIMIGLFAFSLGVERGKQLAAQMLDDRSSAAWSVTQDKTAATVALKQPENAKAKTKSSSSFTVAVGSYKNAVYAKQEALALKAKGFESFLIKKGNLWMLCLGQFSDRQGAEVLLKKVPQKYSGSIVRRI